MISKTVLTKCDITHRTASEVCNILNRKFTYSTSISIKKQDENRACNAKSLLGLLSLVIKKGDTLEICMSGDSIDMVLESLTDYFEEV